jgi:methylenetetrahydrofolate dehydrogenase (NADP+)/methenyltetrahydrofolate cyclohydrolase
VDGFSAENVGKLFLKEDCNKACTPSGIIELIDSTGINIEGKRAVVVGRSDTVGKPVALMLLERNATVTICHSRTRDLASVCQEADILVSAVGKARFITADMVKQDAVVIDVGMNRVDGKLYGDVDYDKVSGKASYITPVPGGVGPMTVAMLLVNTVKAAYRGK